MAIVFDVEDNENDTNDTNKTVTAKQSKQTETEKAKQEDEEAETTKSIGEKIISGYCGFVVRFPYIIMILVIILVAVCAGVVFKFTKLPDFAEPTKGFEARGTYIKGADLGHRHLVETLSTDPNGTVTGEPGGEFLVDRRRRKRSVQSGAKLSGEERSLYTSDMCHSGTITSNAVKGEFYNFAFGSPSGGNLFTVAAMQAVCRFDRDVVTSSSYFNSWQYSYYSNGGDSNGSQDTCQGMSLGFAVGQLAGGTDCMDLTETDVQTVLSLLQTCAPHYHADTLPDNPACNLTVNENNVIHVIMHFLTDSTFLPAGNPQQDQVHHTLLMYNLWDFSSPDEFYTDTIENLQFTDPSIELVAVGADIKFDLFGSYIQTDAVLFGVAFFLILVIMVLYLRSFIVTIATVFNILFSFILSYFLYHIVFRFSFFPFMNVLTGLILIAVGADDVFVFMDVWLQEGKKHPDKDFKFRLEKTLRHASLSVFVTSATTATAFLANIVSKITAIKCFGIFSAIAIVTNFLLMITWVPAVVVSLERLSAFCCSKRECCVCYTKLESLCERIHRAIFHRAFPFLVSRFWWGWILLMSLLGIGGLVSIFAIPRLKLPSSEDFQFFSSNHLLEVWDINMKQNFRFFYDTPGSDYGLTLTYVFGVKNVDNGNHYDPDKTGDLVLDPNFNFRKPEVQEFIRTFCLDLINNAEFVSSYSRTNQICAMDGVKRILSDFSCNNPNLPTLAPPCCELEWPLTEALFDACFYQAGELLRSSSFQNFADTPYFKGSDIKAITITVNSNHFWSASYIETDPYRENITAYLASRLVGAPTEVQGAFVDSILEFYDLQSALSLGTYLTIGISLICATLVMFLTTFNVLITVFAMVTITQAIAITIGTLVLLGWELNILESVTISLAVGMSIDFTIHYGVAYTLSQAPTRAERTQDSFTSIGSAVAMAALTTFTAGASVVSSRVLSYSQLGVFLMLVMAASWVTATFMFQSLCYICGPVGNCAQVPTPWSLCRNRKRNNIVNSENGEIGAINSGHENSKLDHNNSENREIGADNSRHVAYENSKLGANTPSSVAVVGDNKGDNKSYSSINTDKHSLPDVVGENEKLHQSPTKSENNSTRYEPKRAITQDVDKPTVDKGNKSGVVTETFVFSLDNKGFEKGEGEDRNGNGSDVESGTGDNKLGSGNGGAGLVNPAFENEALFISISKVNYECTEDEAEVGDDGEKVSTHF